MNVLALSLILFAQPILPELPIPPELEPHSERPLVLPLENDTIGMAVMLGSPLGFGLFFRQDGPKITYRGEGSFFERHDYYSGIERKAKLSLKNIFKPFQLGTTVDTRNFLSEDSRSFSTASVFGFMHHLNTLTGLELQGCRSTMALEERISGSVLARLFWQAPWFNTLFHLRSSIESQSFNMITDGILQYQSGFILLTPSIQARFQSGTERTLGAGGGLNVIAVFGNLSLEVDGRYSYARPVLLDTFLLAPVKASLDAGLDNLLTGDRLSFGLGFQGVEMNLFAARGEDFFWTEDTLDSLPLLTNVPFSRLGAEVKIKLERPYLSNNGFLRLYFNEPETPWTPLWSFSDSMTAHYDRFGLFAKLDACASLSAAGVYEAPYVVAGAGIFYEIEPFRLSLRVDDILDRRPQLWPGVESTGRCISLFVSLFSSKW